MLNYIDRGVIAANGIKDQISDLFELDNAQYFLYPSMFMVGIMVSSPIFAQLTKTIAPFRLIGVGLSVWCIATAGCGLAWDYWSLLFFRMLVGVGEASFCSMAAPFIDDCAPKDNKATWLAIFYMCIPTGIAFGYIFGGVVVSLTGTWRAAFFLECLLMVPFVLFCFFSPPIRLRGARPESQPLVDGEAEDVPVQADNWKDKTKTFASEMWADTRTLFSHKVFTFATLGYITYTATCGVLINAGPTAGAALFPNDFQGWVTVDEAFGAMTCVTGVVGTAGGGYILDRMVPNMHGAMKVCMLSMAVCTLLLVACFQVENLGGFMFMLAMAELALFAVSGPVNAGYMWAIPPELRPLACALVTITIHVCGDVPSPPVAGWFTDYLQKNMDYSEADAWRFCMTASFSGVAGSALLWGTAMLLARTERDYGAEASAATRAHMNDEDTPETPLLQDA